MARNLYGCTSADFTLTESGRVVAGATATVWTARTGGTQITDLTDLDGDPITLVTSDADGGIRFYGVDGDKDTYWLDTGTGARIAVRPADLTGEIGPTPDLTIGTVTTGTAAATITGTDASPVLNLTLPTAGANGVNTAAIQDGAVTPAKLARQPGNLLSENQASIETDTTGFAAGGAATIARSTAQYYVGAASIAATATGTAAYGINVGVVGSTSTMAAVTAGETYTMHAAVRCGASRGVTLRIYWRDSGGGAVSSTASASNAVTANTWTTLRYTAVAPAGAALAILEVITDGSAGAGEVTYFDALGLWRGAAGVWSLPGVPVTGQSRIAVNNAVDLSGTGTPEGVVTAAPGSTWLQTDATTDVKGWIKWVKASGTGSTGWVAGAEADTGGRNLSAEAMSNGWAVYANVFTLRRIGSQVMLGLYMSKASATDAVAYTLPSGFRPYLREARCPAVTEIADDYVPASVTNGGAITVQYTQVSGSYVYIGMTWMTTDAWPSSLPGTAH